MIRFISCPGCSLMLTNMSIKRHQCNPKIREIQDAAWDEFVQEELGAIDEEIDGFFKSNEAKFMEYLAERDRGGDKK